MAKIDLHAVDKTRRNSEPSKMLVLHKKKIQYFEFRSKNILRKLSKGGIKFYQPHTVRKLFHIKVAQTFFSAERT